MSNNRVNQFYMGLLIGIISLGLNQVVLTTRSQENSVLWDDIHTFTSPGNILIIDNLFFQENWYYEFSFEVVSPHYCYANISITDPDRYNYLIYSGALTEEIINILYGASLSDFHSLVIEVKTTDTLNLGVKVRLGKEICDYHNISRRIILTQTSRFITNESIQKMQLLLDKSDSCWIFVCPITPLYSLSHPTLELTLEDPQNQMFNLYEGTFETIIQCKFQTNSMGPHYFLLNVGEIEYPLNVILIVTLETTDSDMQYSVPLEAHILSGTILVCLLLIPYLILRKVNGFKRS